jgi:hypothetical protein
MSDISIQQPTDFYVEWIVISAGSTSYDVSGIFEEINIYESLFNPFMSGNILIRDSVGILAEISKNPGNCFLSIKMAKNENGDLPIEKNFKITSISKHNIGSTSTVGILEFISQEFIESEQKKVEKSYTNTYSFVVQDILSNYLKVPESKLNGRFEDSIGIYDIIIPNYSPLTALLWCQNRALDINQAPAFLFFENSYGFNFMSLSTLMNDPIVTDLYFNPKNIPEVDNGLYGVMMSSVSEQFDIIKRLEKGVDASTFLSFDLTTRSYNVKKIGLDDVNSCLKPLEGEIYAPIYTNRDNLFSDQVYDTMKYFRVSPNNFSNSSYAKKRGVTPNYFGGRTENMDLVINQRKTILYSFMTKQVSCVLPGNFSLVAGRKMKIVYPEYDWREEGDDNLDPIISGNYLIVDVRHKINFNKHVTIMNISSGYTSNPLQLRDNNTLTNKLTNG